MAKKTRARARGRTHPLSMRRISDEIDALNARVRFAHRGRRMSSQTQMAVQFMSTVQELVRIFCFALDEECEFICTKPPAAARGRGR